MKRNTVICARSGVPSADAFAATLLIIHMRNGLPTSCGFTVGLSRWDRVS